MLGLSLFLLGWSAGPLLAGPLSEVYGRRPVYLVSYTLFVAFSWGSAFASNFGGLLAMRFLSGVGGSCAMQNPVSQVLDLVNPLEINRWSITFPYLAFLGPPLGPYVASVSLLTHAGYSASSSLRTLARMADGGSE